MTIYYFLRRHQFESGEYTFEIMEKCQEHPLGVTTERHVMVLHSEASGRIVVDRLNTQRMEGIIEGMRRFAWWKDGTEYVGTCGTTLAQAIEDVKKEQRV